MVYSRTDWQHDDLITADKLNNIEDALSGVTQNATFGFGGAMQASDGDHSLSFIKAGDPMPAKPKNGDTVYIADGSDFKIYYYNGEKWVLSVDPDLTARINDTLAQAEATANDLVKENSAQVNAVLDDVQAKQADLTAQQAELDTKAQSYADKALAEAKADTQATAAQTAKDASDALAAAKTDLTTSLNKEVTDRANAVTALDTKAKGYADAAKNDAISASTIALNTAKTDLTTSITKEVTDRTKAVSDLDTKAQGYATQAKTDAIATANGAVAKEVTDRQKAITDLDAKSTGAINQAKTDAQSALDALQVGGRNWLLGTKAPNTATGANVSNQVTLAYTLASGMNSGKMVSDWGAGTPFTLSFDWAVTGATLSGEFGPQFGSQPYGFGAPRVKVSSTNTSGHYIYTSISSSLPNWVGTTANIVDFRLEYLQGTVTITNIKLEIGNKATDYTQAPEDIVLDYTTKDNAISQSLTQYQSTNDGKVTKAQSDATQALGLVATKVSQTDYNTKTGDLDSKYTAVKQTADQASTDIVAIKSTNTSQDTKINTLTSDVSGTKQSISDIQTEQGKQSTKINTIQTDVSGTKQDISDIKDANGAQDGKIASISTTVDGLSSSFSTYKTTNDGKVAKAQADITANATAISQKVSQTAYDAKTGQLQTDLNTTTTMANQAKTDIVAIKKTDTDQDARMTTIESNANGVKTTVSSLQTTQNTQAGSISTLQQRADGFDATVTKVNNLSVGGRNLLLHTNTNSYSTLNSGNGQYTTKYVPFDGGYKYQFTYTTASTNWAVYQFWGFVKDKFEPDTDYVLSFMANFSVPVKPSILFANGASGNNFVQQKTTPTVPSGSDQRVVIQLHTNTTIPTASDQSLYMGNFQIGGAGTFTIWDLMIEKGNLASSYTPAPEDLSGATAKAQLTADQATTSLNNYKTDADGRISKAQADIIVNANAITQKVAQTVYDAKVGDLTTKVSTAQQTADSVTTSLNSYKSSNDGKVAKAQADIVVNTNAIATKVSQTAYDAKTGQLQTDLNTTTTTANKAATDIVSIKSDNTKQDARMTTIESDANGTKTTVSNLQTDLGKANGSITTLQQRADGFDATVTKVNSLSVGGRNLFLGTKTFDNSKGVWGGVVLEQGSTYQGLWTTRNNAAWGGPKYRLDALRDQGVLNTTDTFIMSAWVKNTSDTVVQIGFYGTDNKTTWTNPNGYIVATLPAHSEWTRVASRPFKFQNIENVGSTGIRFEPTISVTGGDVKQAGLKLEQGNMPTAWTPAPEDVDSATAKAQLTADQATTSLNSFKTDANGRISKAQADIIVNANAITQKVSQSDYNAKTGDLTTKVNTAQSTADSATSTIGSYKTANDARVASAESKITANANAITQKVSQSDYNTKTGQLDAQISTINQTATGISQSVSNVQTQVNGLSVGGRNVLLDTTSRTAVGPNLSNSTFQFQWQLANNATVGNLYTSWGNNAPISLSFDWSITGSTIAGSFNPQWNSAPWGVGTSGATGVTVSSSNTSGHYKWSSATQSGWSGSTANKLTLRTDNLQGTLTITNLKFEQGNMPTAWSPAPEDVDNKISTVSQTVDSISSIVSDPTTGLTKRVQTAEGTLSQVTGADIPALKKATYWQAPNGYDLNTYLNQGSTFFRDTTARTNAPTTSTKWMYLVVERTPNGDRVTQTAWYDTQTDAKITYRRQYAGTWGAWYANDNDSVTTISQTNSSIKQEISDRQTGDNNTLQSSKDFTVSSISSSEQGMKSLISQKADSVIVGTISDSVDQLKSVTNWQQISYDDLNFLKQTGNYLITQSANTNFPPGVTAWAYVKVEAPRSDRVTQRVWKDLNATQSYVRTFDGTNWSVWSQQVTSSTLLSIFKDSWSLGTSVNKDIGTQITSGIVGNSSNMSLISNSVTINSPQTQIKGTAWINSAMIGNGAIGTAQIGDAAITSAKIASLDVAKITGNVSTFIQSNWNGIFGSTTINSNGMVVNTSNSVTTFDVNGMTINSNIGLTKVGNGTTTYYSPMKEDIGYMGTWQWSEHPNVDYLMIGLHGWQTTNVGDSHYDPSGSDFYGGDGIGFGISNASGDYDMKMTWDSPLVAGYKGRDAGWHVEDYINVHHGIRIEGQTKMVEYFNGGKRAMVTNGFTMSNGGNWYGLTDISGQAGFGVDATQDVWFYVKGRSYSLYSMLQKLGYNP